MELQAETADLGADDRIRLGVIVRRPLENPDSNQRFLEGLFGQRRVREEPQKPLQPGGILQIRRCADTPDRSPYVVGIKR